MLIFLFIIVLNSFFRKAVLPSYILAFKMSKLNPGNWWYYFERIGKSTAKCKSEGCTYSKTLTASHSTNALTHHLKQHHPQLHKQREDFMAAEKNKKEKTVEKSQNPLKRSFAQSCSSRSDEVVTEERENVPPPQSPILLALHATKTCIIRNDNFDFLIRNF
jgi:hypothetical protein